MRCCLCNTRSYNFELRTLACFFIIEASTAHASWFIVVSSDQTRSIVPKPKGLLSRGYSSRPTNSAVPIRGIARFGDPACRRRRGGVP